MSTKTYSSTQSRGEKLPKHSAKNRIHLDQDDNICPVTLWWNIIAVHRNQPLPSAYTAE